MRAALVALSALGACAGGEACTRDEAWCVTTEGDVVRVGLARRWRIGGEGFANDQNRGIWPFIVRSADNMEVLAGVITTAEHSYSGGGASATTLTLYRISLQNAANQPQDVAVPLMLTAP